MKETKFNPAADPLTALLHQTRVAPELPPRFQENVWQRIERAEPTVPSTTWLDALAAVILRPRLAFAFAAVLIFSGVVLGVREGAQTAHHDAQVRYLSSVAPHFQP